MSAIPRPVAAGVRRAAEWESAGVVVPTIALMIVMSTWLPGFSSSYNINTLLTTTAITATVALAQVAVLAVGQFNLALPAMGALVGMTLGWLVQVVHVPSALAVALALGLAILLGALQGWFVVGVKLDALIVTLGLASALSGVMFVLFGDKRFDHLGTALPELGLGSIGTVPNVLLLAAGAWLLLAVLVVRTVFGRQLLATGVNPTAAFLSSIRTGRIVVLAHALSGLLAGVAAVLLVMNLAVASPANGQDWLLPSFAAAVLGGTSLTGGKVSVLGTLLGSLLLAMIANALVITGVSQYWYQAALGVIILAAVGFEQLRVRYVARTSLNPSSRRGEHA